jgi:hypothetical protein
MMRVRVGVDAWQTRMEELRALLLIASNGPSAGTAGQAGQSSGRVTDAGGAVCPSPCLRVTRPGRPGVGRRDRAGSSRAFAAAAAAAVCSAVAAAKPKLEFGTTARTRSAIRLVMARACRKAA